MRAHNLRNMYQIAVIGGNGFLGRAIIHRLSSHQNLRIFSLDKRTHSVPINTGGYKAIVQQVVMDVSNDTVISAWLMAHPVDAIIFAAGFENPTDGLGYTFKEDTKALLALENTLSAINGMNLEPEEPKPFFLYISSWSVYGPQKRIATENTKQFAGNYSGMLRMTAEDLVNRCCTKAGSPYCIVRPSEVYGRKHPKELADGKYWSGYLNYYLDKILRREELIEVFSPETEIDLVHINYFTKVISNILQDGLTGSYNICSGKRIKIRDLIDELLYAYDKQSESSYLPNIKEKSKPKIENMNLSTDKVSKILPYDFEKYNLDQFITDYIKIRRLEIAKRMALESAISEPVILDPTADGAKEKFNERQLQRKINYDSIKKVAGEEFFKLGVGNIVRRTQELEKLPQPNKDISISTTNKLDLLLEEPASKPKKPRKKKK